MESDYYSVRVSSSSIGRKLPATCNGEGKRLLPQLYRKMPHCHIMAQKNSNFAAVKQHDMKKEKKEFESYEGITYEDCWNMDVKLAKIIATHLHAFILAEESGPGGYPGVFVSIYGEDKGYDEWMKILHKMVYAFETYASTKFDGDVSADIREKVDEGMHLFIKYFSYLWI